MEYLLPVAQLLQHLAKTRGFKPNSPQGTLIVLGCAFAVMFGILVLLRLLLPKYLPFVFKNLRRNFLRTALASVAVMVLVFVVTLVWSFLVPLDVVMTEKTKDFNFHDADRVDAEVFNRILWEGIMGDQLTRRSGLA